MSIYRPTVRCAGALFPLSLLLTFLATSACGQTGDVMPGVAATVTTGVRTDEIDRMLTRHFKPGEPGVSVIISQHGTILFRKAYGMANIQTGLALRPELPMRTGSITKQFTAAAIMLLAAQGKLSVTDDLEKYFPGLPWHGRHVTIEHLLTHTSGIRNYTALPQFGALVAKSVSVDEGIDFFKGATTEFQPGQRFAYSNSNYFLLGAIIEKVSGLPYSEFMQQNIFAPLHMTGTTIENDSSPTMAVIGYSTSAKGVVSVPHYSMSWPFAAGALQTTGDDLVRWNNAITTETLLSRAAWEQMATDHRLNDGSRTGYGYGWFVRKLGGSTALEHGGDIGGFSADTWSFPKEEIFLAVLANNDSHEPAPDAIAEKIAKMILRQ